MKMKLIYILLLTIHCDANKVFKLSKIQECTSSNEEKSTINCSKVSGEIDGMNVTFKFNGSYSKIMVRNYHISIKILINNDRKFMKVTMKVFAMKNGTKLEFFKPQEFDWCEATKASSLRINLMSRFLKEIVKKTGKSLMKCPLMGVKKIVAAVPNEIFLNIFPSGFYQHDVLLNFTNDNFFMKINILNEVLDATLTELFLLPSNQFESKQKYEM